MSVAVPNIDEQMSKYQQDGVQFNLLSLCRSPLCSYPEKLAENIHTIGLVTKSLDASLPDWRQFTEVQDSMILAGPDNSLRVTQDLIDKTVVSDEHLATINNTKDDAAPTIYLYQELVTNQMDLQRSYWDEINLIDQENKQANSRKEDHTFLIYDSIKTLSEKGVLKEIVDDCK